MVLGVDEAPTHSASGSTTFTLLNHQFDIDQAVVIDIANLGIVDSTATDVDTMPGTTASTGTLTTATASEFLLAGAYAGDLMTVNGGLSLVTSGTGGSGTRTVTVGSETSGAPGMYSGSFTIASSQGWAGFIVAFKVIASAIRHKSVVY